jgi:general secretion pathway protein A
MYTAYFGLRQAPFSIAPDPRYLYMSQRHREALAHLVYGLQAGGGFVLLTGEIGSGKTTICRSLLEQTPADCQIAYIFNPKLSAVELLQSICEEFRIPLPAEPHTVKSLLGPLNAFLLQAHAAGRNSVLVIDEAQNLSADVLEQLRLLTNLETSERKLLQIILIGQPELRLLLERPELEQLAQRLIARYHLDALDATETRHYIHHRLTVAGLHGPLPFTDHAVQRVHALACGIPRRINLLCDRALLGAYARRQRQVDGVLVNLAAEEVLGRSQAKPWRKPPARALAGLGIVAVGVAAWMFTLDQPARDPTPTLPQQTPSVDDGKPAAALPAVTPSATPLGKPPAAPSEAPSASPPLASLPANQNTVWQALGVHWGMRLPGRDICEAALSEGVQCFRTTQLTLNGLRQLDRPGLLLLSENGVSRWVLAESLQDELLHVRVGARQWTLPLNTLPERWRGEYATFWRLPPGQVARVFVASASDPAGRWLSAQLDQLLPGTPTSQDLTSRVRAFQQRHGLHGDGKALPSTFLLVNRLAGVDEPRLMTHTPR